NHQEQHCRRQQTTPQIVKDFPARNQRYPVWHLLSASVPNARQKVTRNLPITASPAMLSHRIGVVMSRVVVEKFDIGDQRGPGEDRFKKVMTQQRILRNAIGESCFERVHIVEALSRV